MSKTIEDGGLAFPGKRWQQVGTVADHGFSGDDRPTFDFVPHSGMTLREWYAGKVDVNNIDFPDMEAAAQWMGIDAPSDADPFVDRLEFTLKLEAFIRFKKADAMIAACASLPTNPVKSEG